MELSSAGKVIIVVGLAIVGLGVLFVAGSALGLGKLPGDFTFGKGNTRVYVPLATCLVLSLVASVLLALFRR